MRVTSPTTDRTFTAAEAQTVRIEAEADAADGAEIAAVEFFADDRSLGVSDTAPYRLDWVAADGTSYVRAVATDTTGTSSSSSAIPVHVNRISALDGWTSRDVGSPPIPGAASLADGEFTLRGSGKIQGRDGSCHFVYREIEARPDQILELTARVVFLSRPYQGVTAGLMIRDSLDADAQYFMGGLTWHDDGAVVRVTRMATDGTEASVGDFPWDGVYGEVRHYLRLRKRGRELALYVSTNALNWERAGYERMDLDSNLLIGMAVDGNKEANGIANYTEARFTQVSLAL